MKTGLHIQVASTFVCTPVETSLERAVVDAGIADGLGFLQFTQMSEYMLASAPNSPGILGTVVLLRLEDWLREHLKSASYESSLDVGIRQEFRLRVEEFVSQLAILSRLGRQVWFLACPSTGWISERHKLGALCRTYTNLVVARVRGLPQVTLLNWPASLTAGGFEDREADRLEQTPFTPDAFQKLGESVGHQLARTLARSDSSASTAASGASPELAAYLAGLHVRVQLAPAHGRERAHVDRILRTVASFSLTGERPAISEAEVDTLIGSEGCILVTVSDRISEYGCSGLVVFHSMEDTFVVESMALSCTILGKQVEYAVLSALGRIAAGRHAVRMVFEFHPSGRNQPMLAFLQQAADRESDTRYVLPTGAIEARIGAVAVNPGAWTVTLTGGQEG